MSHRDIAESELMIGAQRLRRATHVGRVIALMGVISFVGSLMAAGLSSKAQKLIQEAGNTDDEAERHAALLALAALDDVDEVVKSDAQKMADFARQWTGSSLKFYNAKFKGVPQKDQMRYDFGLSANSVLLPIADLYLGRIIAWNLIEGSTARSSPVLGPLYKDNAVAAFRRYNASFPKNQAARLYLGEKLPWSVELTPDTGAPRWAALQRENLTRLRQIILWWIDHRQRADAQFGGGWGDDCEMWRWWSSVLLGFDDPKIRDAQLRFSRAALKGVGESGFNTQISDVEHAAEDTTDNLVPLLVLDSAEPRWQQWSLSFRDLMSGVWTGKNQRGELQFKSFYFSKTAVATDARRSFDVIADVGALHPTLLAWQRTGDAKWGAPILAWLDTWVAATARAENGKPAGILPAAIRWPDGQAAGPGENWWEPVVRGGFMHSYYVWPSVITEMTDAMVVAYLFTQDERYLAPIRSMAAIRLKHLRNPPTSPLVPGSEAWCADELRPRPYANSNTGGLVKTVARLKALTGTSEFDELLEKEGGEFVIGTTPLARAQMDTALQASVEALRINFAGFTSEVRSTDRVMRFAQFHSKDYRFDDYVGVTLPAHELLYRMVTGDRNAPRFPQMAVRWLTPSEDIAALVTRADVEHLEAELYHFGNAPRAMKAQLWMLRPGAYRAVVSTDGLGVANSTIEFTVTRGKSTEIDFALPPHKLCVLKIEARAR